MILGIVSYLTMSIYFIWRSRVDLQIAFPEPLHSQVTSQNLLSWYKAEFQKGNFDFDLYDYSKPVEAMGILNAPL